METAKLNFNKSYKYAEFQMSKVIKTSANEGKFDFNIFVQWRGKWSKSLFIDAFYKDYREN